MAGVPAEALGGLGLGCSCYTVVVVVMYYLSTFPVAERGPGVECHRRVWVPFSAEPYAHLFVLSTYCTRALPGSVTEMGSLPGTPSEALPPRLGSCRACFYRAGVHVPVPPSPVLPPDSHLTVPGTQASGHI